MSQTQPHQPIRLYRHKLSGHAHRAELFLSLLGLPFERVDIDLAASAHSWLPRDPEGAAAVQRWLSVAAGQIAYGPAAARLVNVFGAKLDHERAKTIAHNLFKLLDAHLEGRQFLVGGNPTIADVAGYSYTAHAPEGDVSLQPYPPIQAWLQRIEQLAGFVPMTKTPVGLAA